MTGSSPSALITDQGRHVLLRVHGRIFEVNQEDLRSLLGLPAGPPGLGITIDGDRYWFEFAADGQNVEMSSAQLHRRLTAQLTTKG